MSLTRQVFEIDGCIATEGPLIRGGMALILHDDTMEGEFAHRAGGGLWLSAQSARAVAAALITWADAQDRDAQSPGGA